MAGTVVAPYPWDSLELVPRHAVRSARRIRRACGDLVTPGTPAALARALGEVLASQITVTVRDVRPAPFVGTARGIHLETANGALGLVIEPEPPLATVALGRVLGRPTDAHALSDPTAPLDPSLGGALAAIAVETARRSGLAIRATTNTPSRDDFLQLDATVVVDDRPYAARIWVFSNAGPTSGDPTPSLARLGGLPITLQLVAAVSEGARSDVESLRPGDVWLPGDGWLQGNREANDGDDARVVFRRAALGAPATDRAVETGRSEGGRIVVRANVIALAAVSPSAAGGERSASMNEPEETLRDIALDAPLVVRVEVASVTLTAREWATLGAGDVIETGVRLTEPVVLRVGGREVARGELVRVDGELGVRIREITDPGGSR